jgi:hypothetical protein
LPDEKYAGGSGRISTFEKAWVSVAIAAPMRIPK